MAESKWPGKIANAMSHELPSTDVPDHSLLIPLGYQSFLAG
jgi:hypothetical protein